MWKIIRIASKVHLNKSSRRLRISFKHFKRLSSTFPSSSQQVTTNSDTDLQLIRNIGIMAHIDAGKTTTTERMLYYSGFTRHLGDVDHGNTVTDYLQEERERGITIVSAAVLFKWNKHQINLIDTPGHVDFTVEVERSLRVLDGAVTVLDASAGVEAQTLTVWKQASRYKIPKIIFLNKMDKHGANFNMCLKSIRERLHVQPIPIHLPIGKERDFVGLVDLVSLEQKIWDSSKCPDGSVYETEKLDLDNDSPSSRMVHNERDALIGILSEYDENIQTHVLNDVKNEDIPSSDIENAIRNITINNDAVIVLCGSAKRNIGVQPLLDAVVKYLPCPSDIKHNFLEYYGSNLCALTFKIVHDKHRGALTYVRVYQGVLKAGESIYNMNLNTVEKIGKQDLFQVNADEYRQVKEVGAGNIACVGGLNDVRSGDTFTDSSKTAKHASEMYAKLTGQTNTSTDEFESPVLAGLNVPPPVFFCSIEAPSVSKQRDMEQALNKIQREDPSLKVELDNESGQLVVKGMGELHLEIVKHRLLSDFGVDAYMGPLQINYREKVLHKLEHTDQLENIIGKTKNLVTMTIQLLPSEAGHMFKQAKFEGEEMPIMFRTPGHVFTKAVNRGFESALNCGPLLSSQVIDVDVVVTQIHVERGTSVSFVSAAASHTITQALEKADCCLMEPIMAMEIHVDSASAQAVMNNLIQRRGEVTEDLVNNDYRILHVLAPLANLVGYSTDLRTMTSGTASFSMELDHYAKLSEEEERKIIQKKTGLL